jgi:peptide/nickel transport system permease protein
MSTSAELTQIAPVDSPRRAVLRRFFSRPVVILAFGFLLLLLVVSLAAHLIAPYDPTAQDLSRVLTGPTAHNWLGTDVYGRDVLSRLIYGGIRSLKAIAEGVAVALAIGVPLGLLAGYRGGVGDWFMSRTAEMLLAIPGLIFVLVVLALVPGSEDAAMVVFGILSAPNVFRVVRAATLKVREELYITAARVSGLSHTKIMVRHILPRISGPIIVQGTIFAAYALLFGTAISFLGLTGDPATPTWGGMVAEASTVIERQPWLLVPTAVLIVLTILSLGLLGDAIRDAAVQDGSSAHRRRARRSRRRKDHGRSQQLAPSLELAPAASGALLEVRELSVALIDDKEEKLIVDRVSFEVQPGEALGLVGESGCGKSVTALAALRLLPPELVPVGGAVRWQGTDLLGLQDKQFDALRGSQLAYVSQEPLASLDPTFTIGSQLREIVRAHEHCSRGAAKERALELLSLVDMPDPQRVSKARSYELSGGMAQRIALAFALAGRPKLLIADEPTTALDVTVQAEILGLLRRLQQETGMAIVVITHNWGVVADLCDRTLVMYAGQVFEQGPAQEMFDEPLNPYTLGLLDSNPALVAPGSALTTMNGSVPTPGAWPTGCRFADRCRFADQDCVGKLVPILQLDEDRLSRCIHVEALRQRVNA